MYRLRHKKGGGTMKKTILIIVNILLIIPFILFYRRGANVAVAMLPVWFAMSGINTVFAENKKDILIYNGCLALFATAGIWLNGQLYFKYVCWDIKGEMVMNFEMMVEVVYIAVLTAIECPTKHIITKRMAKKQSLTDLK